MHDTDVHVAIYIPELTFVWAIMLSCLLSVTHREKESVLVTYKGHSLPAASCGDAWLASPRAHKPPATRMCVVAMW